MCRNKSSKRNVLYTIRNKKISSGNRKFKYKLATVSTDFKFTSLNTMRVNQNPISVEHNNYFEFKIWHAF